MEETRDRVLVGECISRASVEAARGATLGDIDAAIDACDYERATTLALARVRSGEQLGVDVIARILPGIELPPITCALIAIAPERAKLLELVERRRFPATKDASELEAIVLFAAWRAGAEISRVIPQLRRLSARAMTVEGYALLATIAASIDDPNVAAATKPIAAFAKEYAKQVTADEKAMGIKPVTSIEGVIAALPAEIEASRAAGFTVRAAKQVGRNDLCPCGSGLKYKKCCADKAVAAPSPVSGLSWDEFLGSGADRMTEEHVDELLLRDLARVEIGRLAVEPLLAVLQRFLAAREWRHAERVVDELSQRDAQRGDEARDELVINLLECGELARARGHVAKLPENLGKLFELELAIADGPEAGWHALVRAAREAVASPDRVPDIDLAYSLLRAEPALGIVAARACVGTLHLDDPEIMLDMVEEARDRLNVSPNDPAWDVFDALNEAGQKQEPVSDGKLREALHEASIRIDQLERSLTTMKHELDDARTRPAVELMRAPQDLDRAGALDVKVRELEALIREGNAERRELRSQLQITTDRRAEETARRDGPRARRPTVVEADDDAGDDLESTTRGIALPRFDRRAADALGDVPAAVGAEAMRTVGTLAAGDGFTWRGVKQARDMVRPVLMARIGIHHRLLFRVEDGVLDVLDVITREQLMTTLKRLRAAR